MTSDSAPNIELMLADWLPTCIRAKRSQIHEHEAAIVTLRSELGKLEKHAAVEGITVDEPAAPAKGEPEP